MLQQSVNASDLLNNVHVQLQSCCCLRSLAIIDLILLILALVLIF